MARASVSLFQRIARSLSAPAQNRDGYPSWERSIHEQHVQTLASNTLGNTFYASGTWCGSTTRAQAARAPRSACRSWTT